MHGCHLVKRIVTICINFNPPLIQDFTLSLKNFSLVVSVDKTFKGVDRRRTDSNHNSLSGAEISGELKCWFYGGSRFLELTVIRKSRIMKYRTQQGRLCLNESLHDR